MHKKEDKINFISNLLQSTKGGGGGYFFCIRSCPFLKHVIATKISSISYLTDRDVTIYIKNTITTRKRGILSIADRRIGKDWDQDIRN